MTPSPFHVKGLTRFGANHYHDSLGRLAQLARAPRLHRGCRGFESLIAHCQCDDLLSHATTINEKMLESEVLQKQAANNSKEQFANSPDLTSEILTAVMDSMDAQTELSTRALNSEEIREGLKLLLLDRLGLYEKLRSRATSA